MDVQESLDRAAQLRAQADAEERAAAASEERESFDAFWAEVKAQETPRYETILGRRVRVPTTMTLRFQQRVEQIDMASVSRTDVQGILADLFGPEALDAWVDAGMDEEQFAVVMAWAIASAAGREMTWREAYEAVQAKKAERAAKAKAMAAKDPSSKPASGGTGGPSKGGQRRKGSKRKR